MSFQQGLSGLNGASKQLEAIGNNIANANTVGFKSSQAQFADVYANSLTGSGGGVGAGIGTKVAKVAQQFSQGNITGTVNPLDMAINGGGFFRLSNGGTISYARNGQFELDKDGYLVNSGARLTGYPVDANGNIAAGTPTEIRINSASLAPNMTTEVDGPWNFDSRMDVVTAAFDMDDPATYNNATSVTVYDSLGNSHDLQTYHVKTGANQWTIYAAHDGTMVDADANGNADVIGVINFDGATGRIASTVPATMPFQVALTTTTGATSPYTVGYNFADSTQFGATFSPIRLVQDGYASGRLTGFSAGPDGVITGRYTNGKSATLGQVVLASFVNPNGLQPLGNNLWSESATSGQPLVGVPNSGTLGVLQSSAVEDSNVDLTAELVTMITAQRIYQANAQTIKTQDQILQTLVNLK
jgi:flagellar hook protein FlgE